MQRDQLPPVAPITASRYGGDGQTVAYRTVKHHGVPLTHPGVAQGEVAELVGLVHVDPGLVEDEIGAVEAQRQIQRLAQGLEVGVVLHAAWQGEVQMGGGFVVGEVVLAMQGEGDDVPAPRAQGGAAISLVDIEIHDEHLLAAPLVEAGPGCDHQIVEQAEATAKVPMGVVIAAGDLQAAALLEGVTAGGDGGPDRAQGAFNQHG
ncbi:hypothetical protein D3C71_1238380 [compost metagenome]